MLERNCLPRHREYDFSILARLLDTYTILYGFGLEDAILKKLGRNHALKVIAK
ncbi:MAG: hypothetical protein HY735_22935 [Verrucomicrobia bacterium]|nr:hypothetical protein [Verrucomicrobiota bacterium]